MNTYAESKDMKTINWNSVLNALVKGDLNPKQVNYFMDQASDWVTCACGNQCDVIPRMSYGEPFDDELAKLGFKFTGLWQKVDFCIHNERTSELKQTVKELMITLELIENRSIEILEEMS